MLAGQEADGVAHFHRVAGGRCQRLVHAGDQRRGLQPRPVGDVDEARCQRSGVRLAGHEGAGAAFDVEHQAFEPARELLRQDRGGDQRDRFHRRRDIPHAVEALVRRGELPGLADDRAADVAHCPPERRIVGRHRIAGDRFHLVQRAAGMAETAARDHRHGRAAGGDDRRQHQRDIVADAAGRMLVDDWAVEAGPVENIAAVAHRLGQRDGLVPRHAPEEDRHGEGRDLPLGDAAVVEAGDEGLDGGRIEGLTVALGADELLRQDRHQ